MPIQPSPSGSVTGPGGRQRYEGWIVERERDGPVVVRREAGVGAPLNALLGAALVGGGVWLGRIEAGTLASGGLFLAGGLWIGLAVLAWLGRTRIRITDRDLVVLTPPGGERRCPRREVEAVRLVRWDLAGVRPLGSRVVWKVELENGDAVTRSVGFRFREAAVARRFARRLAEVLDVEVRGP